MKKIISLLLISILLTISSVSVFADTWTTIPAGSGSLKLELNETADYVEAVVKLVGPFNWHLVTANIKYNQALLTPVRISGASGSLGNKLPVNSGETNTTGAALDAAFALISETDLGGVEAWGVTGQYGTSKIIRTGVGFASFTANPLKQTSEEEEDGWEVPLSITYENSDSNFVFCKMKFAKETPGTKISLTDIALGSHGSLHSKLEYTRVPITGPTVSIAKAFNTDPGLFSTVFVSDYKPAGDPDPDYDADGDAKFTKDSLDGSAATGNINVTIGGSKDLVSTSPSTWGTYVTFSGTSADFDPAGTGEVGVRIGKITLPAQKTGGLSHVNGKYFIVLANLQAMGSAFDGQSITVTPYQKDSDSDAEQLFTAKSITLTFAE